MSFVARKGGRASQNPVHSKAGAREGETKVRDGPNYDPHFCCVFKWIWCTMELQYSFALSALHGDPWTTRGGDGGTGRQPLSKTGLIIIGQ